MSMNWELIDSLTPEEKNNIKDWMNKNLTGELKPLLWDFLYRADLKIKLSIKSSK